MFPHVPVWVWVWWFWGVNGLYTGHCSEVKTDLYSKTCVKRPLSKSTKIGFQDQFSLKQVKSIAECFLQYFRPSVSYHLSLRSLFCLFLSGRFTQVLLYSFITLNTVFTHCTCSSVIKESSVTLTGATNTWCIRITTGIWCRCWATASYWSLCNEMSRDMWFPTM